MKTSKDMKQLQQELEALGFRLVRSKQHNVWKDPQGRTVVMPQSASDWRAVKNLRSDLKRRGILS